MGQEKRAFGGFLTQFRIEQGHLKVSTFLEKVDLPFSSNYYRDVEAGRKHLSVDAAIELHDSLCISRSSRDSFDYFWNYFKDILPTDIHEMLFGRGGEAKDLSSLLELREHDSKVLRRALSISRYEREFVATSEITKSFKENIDLLPLMTYLYMVESATIYEVKYICDNLNIQYGDRVERFLNLVSRERETKKADFVRYTPTLRMPRNNDALELKDLFLRYELERTLKKPDESEYFSENGSFKLSQMVTIRTSSLETIQDKIIDLLSEIEVETKSSRQLEDDSALPYFFGLIISGRPEYDGRKARRKRDN